MKDLTSSASLEQPTREQIAVRAYQIYLERGGEPGHENDDWLQAEYELMHLPIRKIIELEPPPVAARRSRRKSLVGLVRAAIF